MTATIIAALVLFAGGALTVYTGWLARRNPGDTASHGVPPGRANLYVLGGAGVCLASIALAYLAIRFNW